MFFRYFKTIATFRLTWTSLVRKSYSRGYVRLESPFSTCSARTRPTMTGSTASKCELFAIIESSIFFLVLKVDKSLQRLSILIFPSPLLSRCRLFTRAILVFNTRWRITISCRTTRILILRSALHLSNSFSECVPRWYFTSPEPNPSKAIGLNWVNNWAIGFEQMFTRVFRRPRCAMPMTTVSTPKNRMMRWNPTRVIRCHLPFSADVSMHSTAAAINDSQPSSPNLFSVPYFFARKFSKLTALIIFIHTHFRRSADNSQAPGTSNLSLSQSNWWETCRMYVSWVHGSLVSPVLRRKNLIAGDQRAFSDNYRLIRGGLGEDNFNKLIDIDFSIAAR